jgi:spermidine/putrescine transport system substrate-binding protein
MNKHIYQITSEIILLSILLSLLLAGCSSALPLPQKLILYSWAEYMPQSVMAAFTAEYGITFEYIAYETEEEVVENIQAGNVYDLVLLNPEFIPQMVEEELLKPLDYRNLPNFKYVSANFRDLVFDPGNTYSIPFHWGTTGLLVRTDLVDRPVTSWSDLWNPAFAGKVGIWTIPRSLIPIALKAQGFSANSEDLDELELTRQYLSRLKANVVLVSGLETSVVPLLESGELMIAYGWAYDAALALESKTPIEYIIPQEGTILWMDNFIIPANAQNPRDAELFLNFILRPEIAAQIVNESYYPMAVDGIEPFILPEILQSPVIFPDDSQMQNAEITLPIRPDRKWIYDDIWTTFMETGQ